MKIGRVVRVVKDNSRKEIFNCTNENRTLIMSIFYLADEACCKGKSALYKDLHEPNAERFVQEWAKSDELKQYINELSTNIFINAPIKNVNDKHPVVIYSPGFSCDRDSTVFIIEKLVEHGYIVITLGSPYETDFTIMPNGEVVEMLEELSDFPSNSKDIWRELIDIRKKDILFLMNYLEYIDKNDELLKNKLLLDKIGLIGFSLGSQACFEAAADDERIKAVVLLEGCLHHSTVLERVNRGQKSKTPHMLFKRHASSQSLREEECHSWYMDLEDRDIAESLIKEQIEIAWEISKTQKALYEFVDAYKSFVKIENTKHMTFCDIPVLSNQQYEECFGGKISLKIAHEIISTATLKFLNEFLYNNINEYKNFIKYENTYSKLKEINADGEIKE